MSILGVQDMVRPWFPRLRAAERHHLTEEVVLGLVDEEVRVVDTDHTQPRHLYEAETRVAEVVPKAFGPRSSLYEARETLSKLLYGLQST